MICASIMEKTPKEMVERAKGLSCDLMELRLDSLEKLSDFETFSGIGQKRVFTCMPKWEGGLFSGSEEERITLLESAIPYADYISVELRTHSALRDSLISKAKRAGVKVIVSFHDFEKTPSREETVKVIGEERKAGADICKVAFKANSYSDVLSLMDTLLSEKEKGDLIVSSMGEYGRLSRVLGPLLGSYMTFAAPSREKASAAGQLTVDELNQVLEVL